MCMYHLAKEFKFAMGHRLSKHMGLCKNFHGHNYTVGVGVRSNQLNDNGMVMDFSHLKAVVSGFLFAGTAEAPGRIVKINGVKYKEYSGSASFKEKKKHIKKNPLNKETDYTTHIEGVSSLVTYKGPVKGHIEKLLAGVRSGFSYCGARNINQLWKNAQFIRISQLGVRESGAHDVLVEKEKN